MHISYIAPIIAPTLLAITSIASPFSESVNTLTTTSIHRATKPFNEHYTSIVGNGEFAAIAGSLPLPTNFSHGTVIPGGFHPSSTSSADLTIRTLSPTDTSNTFTATVPPVLLNSTNDPLADPKSIDAIKQALHSYEALFGAPSPANLTSLTPAHQTMISNLTSFIPLLPNQDKAFAELMSQLVMQKLIHPKEGDEEGIKSVELAVEKGVDDFAAAENSTSTGDEGEDEQAGTEKRWVGDDHDHDHDEHSHIPARNPENKKYKSKPITTCPNGSPQPTSGPQDCPPITRWQLAQQQDRELRKHKKQKEKADKVRDDLMITRTVFLSVGCALTIPYSFAWCPGLFAAPGIV